MTDDTKERLPHQLRVALARIEELEAALKDISNLSAGGPHINAQAMAAKVWKTLDKARDIADEVLADD